MSLALVIAGIACALYGVTVMMIGSGSWFFAFWYALAALLVGAGWAIHAGMWDALPIAGKRVIGVVAVMLVVGFCMTQALVLGHFDDRGEPDLDYLIVLGAQVRETGPSRVLAYRLDAAYDYLVENERTTCIVSGGQGPNEPSAEARAMERYLVERGIPAERIIVEDQSMTTAQNVAFSMRLFESEHCTVGIVSNNFHLYRALAIARKSGLVRACGIAARSDAFYLPNNLVRESMSIAKNLVMGTM